MQIMETNCCSYARWKNYLIEKMSLYAEIEVNGQKYWFVHADCNPELVCACRLQSGATFSETEFENTFVGKGFG